ncbi:nucleotidyltransferase domain-containing protein [Bacillus sp. FSL K6-3431]|uniref:nucleotidyltransferase domain-containing protein n=1 Tax=Bacillus sp. FSL K6-3431 TaxID=2921500 RepID=UPI0030F58F22
MTVDKAIEEITRKFEDIYGVTGVVLGGSRAKGNHRPTSEVDIGIYYDEGAGFDV